MAASPRSTVATLEEAQSAVEEIVYHLKVGKQLLDHQ